MPNRLLPFAVALCVGAVAAYATPKLDQRSINLA